MMVNVANYFQSKGADVTLLLISKSGEFLPLVNKNINVIGFESQSKLKYLATLKQILKDNEYDVAFTATPTLNVLLVLARDWVKTKTKVIISERSDTKREFRMGGFSPFKLLFFLMPYTYRSADAIVAVSKGVAKDLAKLLYMSEDKVKVIYNPAYDRTATVSTENTTHEWFVNRNVPVIISAGRLTEQKNFKLLIEAMHLINRDEFKVRLIIIGEGELRHELEQLIGTYNLKSSIQLVGFQLSPLSWIRQADLFVMSSLWEGFGNILVEALSTGTTIVSTNCKSGPAEILEYGKYGYLIEQFEPEIMANMILHALANPMSSEVLLERAQYFEKSRIMKQYESLIDSIL